MWHSSQWTSSCRRSAWSGWATCTRTAWSQWWGPTHTPHPRRTLGKFTPPQKVYVITFFIDQDLCWMLNLLTNFSHSLHRCRKKAGSPSDQVTPYSGQCVSLFNKMFEMLQIKLCMTGLSWAGGKNFWNLFHCSQDPKSSGSCWCLGSKPVSSPGPWCCRAATPTSGMTSSSKGLWSSSRIHCGR